MALTTPTPVRPLAVQPRQPLTLTAASSTNWWARTNGGAWGSIGSSVSTLVWETPSSVTNHLTFDRIDVAAQTTEPVGDVADALRLNLCEGPPATLWATGQARNEAMEAPALRPWDEEGDDPPLGTPLVMAGANRDGVATGLLESASEPGGPVNQVALYGPGLFVTTPGALGARTPFTSDVRGLGPFPRIASYHHGGLYFNHDFGKSRTLGITRVLFEDASGHVAIVRGDGRRNTYRSLGGGAYETAAQLRNTLTKDGSDFVETTPSGRAYRYTSAGRLDRVVDRYGATAYYAYDVNSRLQKVQGVSSSVLGLVPYLSYDGSGLLERLVLEDASAAENNRTTYFQYDADRNLTRIVGAEGCVTYFGYSGDARFLTSVEDPEGFVWRAAYDGNERVDRLVDALSPTKTAYFAYDTATPRVTWKDRADRATYLTFDAWGGPQRVWNVGTPADYYTYDGTYGFLSQTQNRLFRRWTFEYDRERLNRQSVTDPLGARDDFAYDATDLLRFHRDPLGRFTYMDYDAARNETARVDALGNVAYFAWQSATGMASAGLAHFRKDRRGAVTYFAWDARGDLTTVRDPLGNVTYLDYSSASERTSQKDPLGRISYVEYDKRGRVTKTIDPIGAPAYFAYDARCNLVSQRDARMNLTTHAYDGNSNRTRTVDALGNATYFEYDAEERLSLQRDARFNATTIAYDALGRRQRVTDALAGVTYLAHDAAHQLERQLDARDNATYFTYDAAGRPRVQTDAELDSTRMVHDLAGNRTRTLPPGPARAATTIVWTDSVLDTIKRSNADGSGVTTIVSTGLSVPRGVVVDSGAGQLYWLDSGNDTIKRADLDGGNLVTLVSSGLSTPRFLALDALAGTLYWTDSGNDTIKRCDLDGSNVQTLVSTGLDTPEGIVVDPAGGKIYWTDSGTTPSIKRANLDGSGVTPLISGPTHLSSPAEIDLDVAAGKMYWVDSGTDTVKRANMSDGSSVETLVDSGDGLSAPRGLKLDVVAGQMYWVDAGTDKVQRANLDGSSVTDLVTTGLSSPESIALELPPARITTMAFDALDRVTSVTDAIGAVRSSTYDEEGNRLRSLDPLGNTTYLTYDLAGRLTHTKDQNAGVTYSGYDAASQAVLRLDQLGQPTYFAYDGAGRQRHVTNALFQTTYLGYDLVGSAVKTLLPSEAVALYWTDSGSDTIKRCQPDGSGVTTLVSTDLLVPRGIAVDAKNGRMYWIDSGNDTIKRANLDGSGVATLVSTGLSTPRGLALDVASSHMYWTDSGNDTIKRANLDGTSVTTLVNTDLDSPEGIALDLAARKMYWTDSGATPLIKRANLDGTSAEPLVSTGLTSPAEIDLDTLDGHMYWIDSGTDTITRANLDGSGATTLVSGLTTPRGLRLDLARRVMYFIDSGTDKLQRANLDGSSVTDLVTSGLTTPENLAVELPVRVTTHTYDAVNRRTSSTDALGGVSATEYDAVGNVTQQLDARGFAHYFTYDPLNRRTHTTDPVHFAQTYTAYDAVGNVTRQLDPLGATTYMSYDRLNRASFRLDPAGALTYHTFDEVGNGTETHVLLGPGGERRSTYLQYDLVNRTTRRIAADGGATYFGHDLAGNQTLVVDPVGRPTYLTYDRLNRQETRKNAFLDTWSSVYDARSSVTRQIDPVGRTAYMSYDALRRLSSQSNALGETSSFAYDATGNRVRAQNPRGFSTYLRYDVLDRQTHTIDALGGVSYMGYDATGNHVLSRDQLGNPTYMTYDGLGRTTHVKDALTAVSYMGYDERSSAVLRVDADGRATYMAYDVARRLERQHFANPVETADSPIYYGYDQVRNKLYSDDRLAGLGMSYFVYDPMNRVTTKLTLAGTAYYEYDRSGMKVAFKDADFALGNKNYYVYDDAGRLAQEVLDGARTAQFVHDASGLRTRRILPDNKVIAYYTYDNAGRVKQLENFVPFFGVVAYFAYERDAAGQQTWVRHEGDENTYYQYDALDRLTLEERKSSSATMYGFRYAYDTHGNRLNKSVFSAPSSEIYYTHDARNLLTTEQILSGDTSEYAYDLAQRMTSWKVTGSGQSAYFSHDQRNQQTQILFAKASSPDTPRYFAYDGQGERVYVNDGDATYWQHDGNKLVLERLADGTAQRRYRRNKSVTGCADDMVEIVLPSGLRIYQANDPCGSPRTAVDHLEGAPVGQYLTDAFGNPLIQENDATGLAEVRAGWRGAGLARGNMSNTNVFFAPKGLAFLTKPASLTFFGSQVWIAIGGPDCDDFLIGCVPPPPPCYCATDPVPEDCHIEIKWLSTAGFARRLSQAQARTFLENIPHTESQFETVTVDMYERTPSGGAVTTNKFAQQMGTSFTPTSGTSLQFSFSPGPVEILLQPIAKTSGCSLQQHLFERVSFPVGRTEENWNHDSLYDIGPGRRGADYQGWRYSDWPFIPFSPAKSGVQESQRGPVGLYAFWQATVTVVEAPGEPKLRNFWGFAGNAQWDADRGMWMTGNDRWKDTDRRPDTSSFLKELSTLGQRIPRIGDNALPPLNPVPPKIPQ